MAFKYGANGEVPPARKMNAAARGTWGVALDLKNDEIAVTVEHINQVEIYRREATEKDKPLRIIQGPNTGMSDPHGIAIDTENVSILVFPKENSSNPRSAFTRALQMVMPSRFG